MAEVSLYLSVAARHPLQKKVRPERPPQDRTSSMHPCPARVMVGRARGGTLLPRLLIQPIERMCIASRASFAHRSLKSCNSCSPPRPLTPAPPHRSEPTPDPSSPTPAPRCWPSHRPSSLDFYSNRHAAARPPRTRALASLPSPPHTACLPGMRLGLSITHSDRVSRPPLAGCRS